MKFSRGFTLVEMMVSLAIFSVVAVVAVGALVRVVSANRQAQSIQTAVNTISFVLESMTREMRVGSNFNCSTSVPSLTSNNLDFSSCYVYGNHDDQYVSFNSENYATGCFLIHSYQFQKNGDNNFTILKATQSSCNADLTYYPILPSTIKLTSYTINVSQINPNDYAWAFFRLKGSIGTSTKEQSTFDVQTSVSQRTKNKAVGI